MMVIDLVLYVLITPLLFLMVHLCQEKKVNLQIPHFMKFVQLVQNQNKTIGNAIEFLQSHSERGTTDIKTPLLWAIETLKMNKTQEPRLQFVVLITDGAVQEEKEIVADVKKQAEDVRVLTFGIGRYCNWYFLKMLALYTRGWNGGTLKPEKLVPKMKAMLKKAAQPVLNNIEVGLGSVGNVELFPSKIPDLFLGGPLVIAGKFSGQFPTHVFMKAQYPRRETFQMDVPVEFVNPNPELQNPPIQKIFVKQQLDQLTSIAWLNGDQKVVNQIVDISCNEEFPSPHTTMVAYEVDQAQKDKMKKEEEKIRKKEKKGPSGATIAKVAGGIFVIGVGAALIGSVAM
eukprot:UN25113